MTKTRIERELKALGLRLEKGFGRDGWIIRPDTVGPCHANSVITLRRLADAEDVIDHEHIRHRDLAGNLR